MCVGGGGGGWVGGCVVGVCWCMKYINILFHIINCFVSQFLVYLIHSDILYILRKYSITNM